jgi:hypothetical protein
MTASDWLTTMIVLMNTQCFIHCYFIQYTVVEASIRGVGGDALNKLKKLPF